VRGEKKPEDFGGSLKNSRRLTLPCQSFTFYLTMRLDVMELIVRKKKPPAHLGGKHVSPERIAYIALLFMPPAGCSG
jgi:hypothetical protein